MNAAATAPRRWTLTTLADLKGSDAIDAPCLRCGGADRIVVFAHVMGGRCFACGGSRVRSTTVKAERARLRGIARRREQEAARVAKNLGSYADECDEATALIRARFGFEGATFPAPATYSDGGDWAVWIDFCRATDGLFTGMTPRDAIVALR